MTFKALLPSRIFLLFTTSLFVLAVGCQAAAPTPPMAGIPSPLPSSPQPGMHPAITFEIIPDSELFRGPGSLGFSITDALKAAGGELSGYSDAVGARDYNAAALVERVSRDYSVNARILLAVIEYRSGWVTGARRTPVDDILGLGQSNSPFFSQLNWLANELNRGFYACRVEALQTLILSDGGKVARSSALNCASAALQHVFGLMDAYPAWELAVGPLGVQAAYRQLFGEPSTSAQQQYPKDLTQPTLRLPFEDGQPWYYTSGPHSAWGNGAAWAALDFAPAEGKLYCYQSDAWITAAADGVVARSEDGGVVLDLNGDGLEETGWTLFYMHVATRDRVALGASLKAGERIGHPSCEGGTSSGSHVHIARRYNGEWIPADQNIPFDMDGWISSGSGEEYEGTLTRGGITITAQGYPANANQITR